MQQIPYIHVTIYVYIVNRIEVNHLLVTRFMEVMMMTGGW